MLSRGSSLFRSLSGTRNKNVVGQLGLRWNSAKTAFIFKNGYGVVTSEYELEKSKTFLDIQSPKNAIHGGMWATTPNSNTVINSIETVHVTREEEIMCTGIPQILQANLNQVVEVQAGSDWIIGRVNGVQRFDFPEDEEQYRATEPTNGVVVLDSDTGSSVIPLSRINTIRLPLHPPPKLTGGEPKDQMLTNRVNRIFKDENLRINYTTKESSVCSFSYLTRGLCWAPSYKLDLRDGKSGVLSMNSVIMNDAEELEADEVVCVSSTPFFNSSDQLDPLMTKIDITSFLTSLRNPAYVYAKRETALAEHEEEVQNFTFKQISIASKDRVSLPVFEAAVQYQEVHHVELQKTQKTWKSLKIANSTQYHWTGAPILFTKNGGFLGQALLSPVPKGANGIVNVAEDPAVEVKLTEEATKVTGYAKNGKSVGINLVLTRNSKLVGEISIQAGETKKIDISL